MNRSDEGPQQPARVLALHAHPDDCEILAGGTLALLADAGHAVTIVSMTAGDCGSDVLPAGEIAALRREEAAAAARSIGAAYECLNFLDLAIFLSDESRRKVTAGLRRHRPDVVLTASPVDYHCDHEATSSLVLPACFAAAAPNYDTGAFGPAPALPAIPHLYFMDPIDGVDRDGRPVKPDFIVDVEPVLERKKLMLACHASQRDWLKRMHGIDDYIEQMVQWTAKTGKTAWVSYGEGFRHYTGHPYPQSPLLERLLDGVGRVVNPG